MKVDEALFLCYLQVVMMGEAKKSVDMQEGSFEIGMGMWKSINLTLFFHLTSFETLVIYPFCFLFEYRYQEISLILVY